MEHENTPSSDDPGGPDRRDFLKKCGTFAAVTPPAITMLLSTSLTSNAIAKSGNGKPKWAGGKSKDVGGGKPEWASGGKSKEVGGGKPEWASGGKPKEVGGGPDQSASSNKGGKK
jgi:hypothetical protein